MNSKAQIETTAIIGGLIALVVLVIGLPIINGATYDQCNAYTITCETKFFTNLTTGGYTALDHGRIIYDSQTAYNTTDCTGAALVNGTNYSMNLTDGGIHIIGNTPDSDNKSITYRYHMPAWIGDGAACTVVNNWMILFALGGLVLAGAWLLTR